MAKKNNYSHLHMCKDCISPECRNLERECDTCFLVARSDQVISSLLIMIKNQKEKPLYDLIGVMGADKIITSNNKGQRLINDLKKLATDYSLLETKTQRAAMTIQSYKENCAEAAKDFLKDGNVGDLLNELNNVKETETSLKDVIQHFELIK
jgi:hypothetical protein